jgi:hypothetical protein
MARIVTVRRKEGGGITVRCGEDVIGFVTRLEGGDVEMRGHFAPGPDYSAYAQLLAAGDAAAMEQRGVHVFSAVHEMRIDDEATLVIAGEEVRFRPAQAFIVLRSGGLG